MKRSGISLCLLAGMFLATLHSPGQSKKTARRPTKESPTIETLQAEMHQMREELQAQIDSLKHQLADRDSQLASTRAVTEAQPETTSIAKSDIEPEHSTTTKKNEISIASPNGNAIETKASMTEVATAAVQQPQGLAEKPRTSLEELAALHYKGITIVPGGFLAGESVWRQRAMNADMYTNFNASPYMNSGDAHVSEWVPSARQSRLSTLVTGKVPFGTLKGYVEGDFLSAGITSNNLQSNSYTLRLRQAWGQAAFGRFKFTAGQMWTLLTENKKGTDPGQEAVPLIFDANMHVGYTYIRQTGFRLQDAITPKLSLALALENSQYQFSASNAPSNFFFGNAGATGGLNNSAANYTHQAAPDILFKAAFDPGHGHYEIGGIMRFFRDRYYPDGTSSGNAQNDTRIGGGLVANARFPVAPKAEIGLHLVAGDGTGRYGASLLPDITVRPAGTLAPLRNAQAMFSLELHPTRKLDLFAYTGTEYVQRTTYRNAAGVLVGYAPVSGNNSGCNTEASPSAGSGYAPGASACLGATRALFQGSAGWVYRIYTGPVGKLQYGIAYSYLTREGWSGLGGSPKATNNIVYTSFRYYIP